MKGRVVVIGGGFSGLASAALLAKDGYNITLIEKNNQLGGRARVLKSKGFSFDMGPSWYMMPEVFEKFFSLFNKKPSQFYQLKRLDPRYRVFFDKRGSLDLLENFKDNQSVFEKIEPGAGKKLSDLISDLKPIYTAVSQWLIYNSYFNFIDLINKKNLLKTVPILVKTNPLISVERYINQRFSDDRLKKILEFSTVFLGGSPYNTPAVYSLLIYADFIEKIWYPVGGMKKIVDALYSLGNDYKVKYVLGESAEKITVNNGKAEGVVTSNSFYPADYIVSSADYAYSEISLLDSQWQTYPASYWQEKTYAISAILIYLGVKGRIKNMLHHNLYFCADWSDNFNQIFKQKAYPEDPSFYISVRSKSDKTIAPSGTEEIFILVPVSPGISLSNRQIGKYVSQIIKKIEEISKEQINSRIIFKKIYHQNDFYHDYNAYQGTALGLAHTLNQSILFRPKNKSRKVSNLFYVGQYTNPGVGVPMCLVSAQIVHKMINDENK